MTAPKYGGSLCISRMQYAILYGGEKHERSMREALEMHKCFPGMRIIWCDRGPDREANGNWEPPPPLVLEPMLEGR